MRRGRVVKHSIAFKSRLKDEDTRYISKSRGEDGEFKDKTTTIVKKMNGSQDGDYEVSRRCVLNLFFF